MKSHPHTPRPCVCCNTPRALRLAGAVLASLCWLLATVAPAATVLWKAPNTTVHLGLPYAGLEFENPLPAGATLLGRPLLDWRDADYAAGPPPWFDDWVASDPAGISGDANEIWLRREGHSARTITTLPGDGVSIHLIGDANSGLAEVRVDSEVVARLNLHSPLGNHTALVVVHGLAPASHSIQVLDLGPAPGMQAADVRLLGAAALGASPVKWEQPPLLVETTNTFYGWNEPSMSGLPPMLAADDWVCTSTNPVTKVRWWGSFPGWRGPLPPEPAPDAFEIAFWSDVPAGPNEPFSHPGEVRHVMTVTSFSVRWVGWDFDPRSGVYESCFLYEADLPQSEWFYQEPGPVGISIYWLSISASYPAGAGGPVWGWKTRPRDPNSPAPDAAVGQMDVPPGPLTTGQPYRSSIPLHWPDSTRPWDLAFELSSDYDVIVAKYEQPPELDRGIDVNATYNAQALPPMTNLLADDFPCTVSGPLTHITVWASWRDDLFPGNDPRNARITLSIHTNVPVGPNGWSIPGQALWWQSFGPGAFDARVEFQGEEGWLDPPNAYVFPGDRLCVRYDFDIPGPLAFQQQGTPEQPAVYWLDVQAEPLQLTGQALKFGWKTSRAQWMDAGVWVRAREPYHGAGWQRLLYPAAHPKAGQRLDLAFGVSTSRRVTETKWSQPPALFQPADAFNGWNQPSVHGWTNIVADDWVCTNGWPVTDLHWWGSFVNWGHWTPPELPTAFVITFWTDVPAGPVSAFSHPGQVLHQVRCTNFVYYFAGWDFDPRQPQAAPEACFKFEQELAKEEWFHQAPGTNIYWVSIAAEYPAGQIVTYPWGWKTRPRDAQSPAPDDAVNVRSPTAPAPGSHYQQGYPIEFPQGVSWDAAFTLTTREPEPELDFGDAPDAAAAPGYPTLLANNGARHTIVPGVFLGMLVDAEADGQPDPLALGDDSNPPFGPDDEDGVSVVGVPGPLLPGHPAQVIVTASVAGYFSLWIDYDGDGSWLTPGDAVFTAQPIAAGTSTLSFLAPAGARGNLTTFARARFCTQPAAIGLPDGAAPDGEVEDYAVRIEQLDYGDAPDPSYPTRRANNGARHVIMLGGPGVPMALGSQVDAESDGQPDAHATGDDLNPPLGLDDEDGVGFHTALMPGVPNTITVTTTVGGWLQGFIDLNADGDWNDPGEHVLVDRAMAPGANAVTFTVASLANVPATFARFRLSSQRGLGPTGLAIDGEVEDYEIALRPVKWLQPPEVGSEGVDVDNRWNLADDFQCTRSGPITDIHLWGSFLRDQLPPGGPTNMGFVITLFSDVPRGPGNPYSHPGQPLWTRVFPPGTFDAALCTRTSWGEWWHAPAQPVWWFPGDTNIYQFDFHVPARDAFRQVEGTIYWLAVKYLNQGPGNFDFGWKTTWQPSWNDDACWFEPTVGAWRELRYAFPHPRAGESLDLAFALATEGEEVLDFGDAPDGVAAPGYPTLLANNGARHVIRPGMFLGALIDAEADGQPDAAATGDDLNGFADEDGVVCPGPLAPGLPATVQVTASAAGFLNAWIDWQADGSWATTGDQVFVNVPLSAGTSTLNFLVPAGAAPGVMTFARFRFSSATNLTFSGAAPDGEVEDYAVRLLTPPESDLGDAPDSSNSHGAPMTAYPGVPARYPTVFGGGTAAGVGPLHQFPRQGGFLGASVSGEQEADTGIDMDGLNNLDPPANASNLDGAEDGVVFPLALPHCRPTTMQVRVTIAPLAPPTLYLNVWFDWNRDGDWQDTLACPNGQSAPEWAVQNLPITGFAPGLHTLATPPFHAWHPSLEPQPLWLRVSLSEMPRPAGNWTGAAGDGPAAGYLTGETEDYNVPDYSTLAEADFGDAPDPTYPTLWPGGAWHGWMPGFCLGLLCDTEPDGQPHPGALGDDLNPPGLDDEDGVALPATLRRGSISLVNVVLTSGPVGGFLDGWVDFNRDGLWANLAPERVLNAAPLSPGLNMVSLSVPLTAKLGPTFARFRLSSRGGLAPDGAWLDGEVEDYAVILCQRRPTVPVEFTGIVATNAVIGGSACTISTVQWLAEAGIEYQLQATSSLSNAPACTWVDVGPPVLGPANSVTETNLLPAERYYRLVVPFVCP